MSTGDTVGAFFLVGMVGLIVFIVVAGIRDDRAHDRRVDVICASSFRQSRTGHDSLTIAALNNRCAQMLKDSVQ